MMRIMTFCVKSSTFISASDAESASAPGRPWSSGGAPLLLITTVDIGMGRSDKIELRHCDDPVVCTALSIHLNLEPPSPNPVGRQH